MVAVGWSRIAIAAQAVVTWLTKIKTGVGESYSIDLDSGTFNLLFNSI